MSGIDWLVLVITLTAIILYGMWKSRGTRNIDSYLLADKQMKWYGVGLSVMATQASAITFLSGPAQAYTKGMAFVQFYFGLPLAMIVLCITFIPIFHRLKVYTAYEFLEKRFDLRTRTITLGLFLIQRGISTGITIYAPAIILSSILGIDVTYTTLLTGIGVILYTVYGGTKAVAHSQIFQMAVIFAGLIVAGVMVVKMLPEHVSFGDALHIAGKSGRTNVINLNFDLRNDYNVWSGVIGGFFLQLSYFGTDQSQVGRYLTGKSVKASRLGLVMNGLLKVPMQFGILLIGALVFAFYQFHRPPVFFNPAEVTRISNSTSAPAFHQLERSYDSVFKAKTAVINSMLPAIHSHDEVKIETARQELAQLNHMDTVIRSQVRKLMKSTTPGADTNDANYIFLNFVTTYLPKGLIGLLIAIIFLAAMGATASGINALTSTTVVDCYKRLIRKDGTDAHYLKASRLTTVFWGGVTMIVALFAGRMGNLLEAVNILGSLVYGTILGIFLVAFYAKSIGGRATFWAAITTETIVILLWSKDVMAFLWLNLVGAAILVLTAVLLEGLFVQQKRRRRTAGNAG
jgi:SSS family solute:Na+ symporter